MKLHPLTERYLKYLDKQTEPISVASLRRKAGLNGYTKPVIDKAFDQLQNTSRVSIGWNSKTYREEVFTYPESELTKQLQSDVDFFNEI